jgi:enoyl-CoA hydratase
VTSQTEPALLVERDDRILRITLNRPAKLNAVNRALHDALAEVWSTAGRRQDVDVVVLTGAGRAFCAGGDVSEFAGVMQGANRRREMAAAARAIVMDMIRCPLPIIAAVNGPAVGLGCSLALLSDVVVMSEDAFLADTHVQHGLVPGDGGFVWPLLTGMMQAKLPLLVGDRVDAAEAFRLGLATRTCSSAELAKVTDDIARRIASMPRGAVQDTKRMLNLYLERSVNGVLDFAMAAESLNFVENLERERADAAENPAAETAGA